MSPSDIHPESDIEDVVQEFPDAVTYLLERHGIRVICCGAPIWATVRQLAETNGLTAEELVAGLRDYLSVDLALSPPERP